MFFFFLDKKWCVNTVIKVIVKHICPMVLSHLGVSECRAVGLHQIWLDCAVAWWGEASCGRGGTISGDTNQDAAPWGASVCELFLSRGERERREAHREAGHLTMEGPECSVRLQGRRRCVRVSEAYPL